MIFDHTHHYRRVSAPFIFVQLRILQTRAGKMPAAKWHLSIVASGPPNNHHSVCHFTALSTYWHPPGIVSGHHTALNKIIFG